MYTVYNVLCSQVLEVRDEAASGSDGESVQSWAPSQSTPKKEVTASGKKCLSAIFTEVLISQARINLYLKALVNSVFLCMCSGRER